MPDNKNNDVINDILNELDSRSTQPEESAEQETTPETNFIDDPAIEETQQIPDPVSATQKLRKNQVLKQRREMYVLRQPFLQKVKKEKERGKETDFRAYLFLQYLFSLYQYAYRL